jgi:hypothetical protein
MKKTLLIILMFAAHLTHSQSSYWTSQHTSMAIRGYDDLEKNSYYFLQESKIEESQKELITPIIKSYYDTLLSCYADFNNNKINREELRKQRAVAYYNYNEGLKSVLTPSQFELYQRFGHYNKVEEKKLKKYLKKYGLIKG